MNNVFKKTLFYCGLFLFSFLSLVFLSEVLIRLINPYIPYQYMPQRIYEDFHDAATHAEFSIKKNYNGRFLMSAASFDSTVQTNSLGWRDTDPDRRNQILVFGDSFVFGFGLNNGETIPDDLEKMALNKINFVNLGYTAGRSPDSYAIFLKNESFLQRKYTILLICSNDLSEIASNYYVSKTHTEVDFNDDACFKVENRYSFVKEGKLFSNRNFFTTRLPAWSMGLLKRSYLIAFLRDRLNVLHSADKNEIGKTSESSLDPEVVKTLFSALTLIKQLSMELIVFCINDDDSSSFFKVLRSYCVQNNIKCYPIPVFDKTCYFERDGHYNKKGALCAAKVIFNNLPKNWLAIN